MAGLEMAVSLPGDKSSEEEKLSERSSLPPGGGTGVVSGSTEGVGADAAEGEAGGVGSTTVNEVETSESAAGWAGTRGTRRTRTGAGNDVRGEEGGGGALPLVGETMEFVTDGERE